MTDDNPYAPPAVPPVPPWPWQAKCRYILGGLAGVVFGGIGIAIALPGMIAEAALGDAGSPRDEVFHLMGDCLAALVLLGIGLGCSIWGCAAKPPASPNL